MAKGQRKGGSTGLPEWERLENESLMEKYGNKTIMSSVLFLDIVEYSRMSVSGQISLKERFNTYLAIAISNVPVADRIILDTGDGAAVNFLGDVEDALNAVLSLRASMRGEDSHISPPLLMRMGINHGPVRLVRDINGQPNIVGDGINVAQRIMGFANAGQILVSRSYFDAVSRLSPTSAVMFNPLGSRTDKHVREHEVYSIEDSSGQVGVGALTDQFAEQPVVMQGYPKKILSVIRTVAEGFISKFKQFDTKQRNLFVAGLVLSLVLVVALFAKLAHHGAPPVSVDPQLMAAKAIQPISAVVSVASAVPAVENKKQLPHSGKTAKVDKVEVINPPDVKPVIKKTIETKAEVKKAQIQSASVALQVDEAFISIRCKEGTKLFVDDAERGQVTPSGLIVKVKPGKHRIIAADKNGNLHPQNVEIDAGKTAVIKPHFCE